MFVHICKLDQRVNEVLETLRTKSREQEQKAGRIFFICFPQNPVSKNQEIVGENNFILM